MMKPIIDTQLIKKSDLRQILKPRVLDLIILSYSAKDTETVTQSVKEMKEILSDESFMRFNILEELMVQIINGRHDSNQLICNNKQNLYSAIVNLAYNICEGFIEEMDNNIRVNGPFYDVNKGFMYKIQHFLDCSKIQPKYKKKLALAYVKLQIFFDQILDRLIRKVVYKLEVYSQLEGLMLLSVFIENVKQSKALEMFFHQVLPVLLKSMDEKLFEIADQKEPATNDIIFIEYLVSINALLENWKPYHFTKELESFLADPIMASIVQRICLMCNEGRPKQLLFEILMRLAIHSKQLNKSILQIPLYIEISMYATSVFNFLMDDDSLLSNAQSDKNIISFLSAAIESKIFLPDPTAHQLLKYFLTPMFYMYREYLANHHDDFNEIINFLKDAIDNMQSECIQILMNKLLVSICKYNNNTCINFKQIIFNVLECQLPLHFTEVKQTKNGNVIFQTDAWTESIMDIDDRLKTALLFISLQMSTLMTDSNSLNFLQEYFIANFTFFTKRDVECVFFLYLMYQSYIDDIWVSKQASKMSTYVLASLEDGLLVQKSIVTKMAVVICQDKLELRYPLDLVQNQVESIMNLLNEQCHVELLPCLRLIINNYEKHLNTPKLLTIMDKMLQNITLELLIKEHVVLQDYYEVLEEFFNHAHLVNHFDSILEKFHAIICAHSNKIQWSIDVFLKILGKGLKSLKRIPIKYASLLENISLNITGPQSITALNLIIIYQPLTFEHSGFLNRLAICLVKQMNYYNILALHNIIKFHSQILNQQTVRSIICETLANLSLYQSSYNFMNGKNSLTLLLLMRYNFDLAIKIMESLIPQEVASIIDGKQKNSTRSSSWWRQTFDTQIAKQKYEIRDSLKLLTQQEEQSCIQQSQLILNCIFSFIYGHYDSYQKQYDIPVFLHTQIELFINWKEDFYQKQHACHSIMAIIECVRKYFQLDLSNNYDDDEDEMTSIQKKRKEVKQAIDAIACPEFKEIDMFHEYHTLNKYLLSGPTLSAWFAKIKQQCIDEEWIKMLDDLGNLKKVGHSIRKIQKPRNADF